MGRRNEYNLALICRRDSNVKRNHEIHTFQISLYSARFHFLNIFLVFCLADSASRDGRFLGTQ